MSRSVTLLVRAAAQRPSGDRGLRPQSTRRLQGPNTMESSASRFSSRQDPLPLKRTSLSLACLSSWSLRRSTRRPGIHITSVITSPGRSETDLTTKQKLDPRFPPTNRSAKRKSRDPHVVPLADSSPSTRSSHTKKPGSAPWPGLRVSGTTTVPAGLATLFQGSAPDAASCILGKSDGAVVVAHTLFSR